MPGQFESERAKELIGDARIGRQTAAAILRSKKDALEGSLIRTGAQSRERRQMQMEINELSMAIGLLVKQHDYASDTA